VPFLATMPMPDIVVLSLVGYFGLRGALRGFTWQALRTGGLVLGFVLASRLGPGVGAFLADRFALIPARASDLVGWTAVVLLTFVAVTMVARLAREAVRASPLTGIDRFMGLVLGMALGLGLAAIAFTLWAWNLTDEKKREMLGDAVSTRWMAKFVSAVAPALPQGVRDSWTPVLAPFDR
jgi:uncharacterized membrane protein required for colicin V production